MSGNEMTTVGLLKAIESHTDAELTDIQRVGFAKKKYLIVNKEEIIQAVEIGYKYNVIASVASAELMKTGVPATFSKTNKEGAESTNETKFRAGEIKKFYERMV